MEKSKSDSTLIKFCKWFFGVVLVGLLFLVGDKLWDQNIRKEERELAKKQQQEEIARQNKITQDKVRLEEAREDERRALEQKRHREHLQAIKEQEKTMSRLFSELVNDQYKRGSKERTYHEQNKTVQRQTAAEQSVVVTNSEPRELPEEGIASLSKLDSEKGLLSVQSIFVGEQIDLCGYKGFSIRPIDNGARFEIKSNDRKIPNREFTGWQHVAKSQTSFNIADSCAVSISSEKIAGNTMIYFKVIEGTTK